MYCKDCGNLISSSSKFCQNCGQKVINEELKSNDSNNESKDEDKFVLTQTTVQYFF